jgi:dihydroxyacetone kinase
MKKIINNPENLVAEMCEGMVAAHPNKLAFKKRHKLLMRKTPAQDKVALISGGGSGHEPAHAGYVGEGMLDIAVCGDVFASPSTIQVYNAILESESDKGTLLIIKNYSGDIMNFEAAAEMAEEEDDIKVAKVYVNDDIAVKDSLFTVGRRGVAGSVYVHKIAGAAAEAGHNLEEVKRVAEKVIANVKSIGFALTSCTVPAKGTPTFELAEDEIEFGVGIHGEPGVAREKTRSADELATECLERLLKEMPVEGEEIAVMINGFGSTPLQELYVLNQSVSTLLAEKGVKVYNTLVGNYMTALDMAGASITLLKLDDELKNYLDAPVNTVALRGV